jgi:sulfur relay (sulfurtransferase) DsrF/TusC family protein
MPSLLCLVLDEAPYGALSPAEAIRHAGGAVGKGWEVVLAFMGDSVYTLLPGQAPPPGEWVCLSEAVTDLIEAGNGRAQVLADQVSLEARGLSASDLVAGVRAAPIDEIAHTMADCDRTLMF